MGLAHLNQMVKRVAKNSAQWTSGSWSKTKDVGHSARLKCGEIVRRAKSYADSSQFEIDLDTAINWLHIHKPSSAPNFSTSQGAKERVAAKARFLSNQVRIFILAGGAFGAECAPYAGIDSIIGFAVGIGVSVMIVIIAGVVFIVKRTESGDWALQPI